MYAIFEDGGKQYKVSEGDMLLVELRDLPEGQDTITFDQVMMVGGDAAPRIGAPFLSGASVTARLVEALKMPKVTGVKFSRRKGYKLKFGHRQRALKVSIEKISG